MCVRVELKGARITDLVETFFTRLFYVEFSDMCSAKGSVRSCSPAASPSAFIL